MSVTNIREHRSADCGERCFPRSCDAETHYAAGYDAGYAWAQADRRSVPVRTGPLVIDLSREVVMVDGVEIALSDREWGVLAYLAERAGYWCRLDDIVGAVWGVEWLTGSRRRRQDGSTERTDIEALRTTVDRLRVRLGPARSLIETQRGGRMMRRLRIEGAL